MGHFHEKKSPSQKWDNFAIMGQFRKWVISKERKRWVKAIKRSRHMAISDPHYSLE
jgi:hypothetical protein